MDAADLTAAEQTAATYYNSDDADQFYAHVWGGEDIHIGLYEGDHECIAAASRRTVEDLARLIGPLEPGSVLVDLGSGYGGAARYLASTHQLCVEAVNISSVEIDRHRMLNHRSGLQDLIRVHDASFEAVPLPNGCADVVWSQDAILHAGDRQQVLREAARLLKPGGVLVFTDPMAADGVTTTDLSAILQRIHLADLGSPERYCSWGASVGLEREVWDEQTAMLVRHYTRVHEEPLRRTSELKVVISIDYMQRMAAGLQHWIDGGESGRLSWGLMRFRKRPLDCLVLGGSE